MNKTEFIHVYQSKNYQKKEKSLSSIQVKKEQSAAVIQMVWNGRVSVHDLYETTRIFYEKDDFSFSDTGDSEEKNPSFPKG